MTLNIYEVTFSTDDITSCIELKNPPDFEGDLSCKANGNLLMSAYIRADCEKNARGIAKDLQEAYYAHPH